MVYFKNMMQLCWETIHKEQTLTKGNGSFLPQLCQLEEINVLTGKIVVFVLAFITIMTRTVVVCFVVCIGVQMYCIAVKSFSVKFVISTSVILIYNSYFE